MRALAALDFKNPTCLYSFTRIAIWACMATSPKKSDGFARILSKVDLDKVKGPGMRSRLDEMEPFCKIAGGWQQQLQRGKQPLPLASVV